MENSRGFSLLSALADPVTAHCDVFLLKHPHSLAPCTGNLERWQGAVQKNENKHDTSCYSWLCSYQAGGLHVLCSCKSTSGCEVLSELVGEFWSCLKHLYFNENPSFKRINRWLLLLLLLRSLLWEQPTRDTAQSAQGAAWAQAGTQTSPPPTPAVQLSCVTTQNIPIKHCDPVERKKVSPT